MWNIAYLNDKCVRNVPDHKWMMNFAQGSARRKKKVIHKTAVSDDKKLQASLKKLGLSPIPSIEEVKYEVSYVVWWQQHMLLSAYAPLFV